MKNDFMIQFGFGFVQKMLVVQKHFDIKIKTKKICFETELFLEIERNRVAKSD